MNRPKIHLVAPAGSCRPFFDAVGVATAAGLIALIQEAVGAGYLVTGDGALLEASEDERHGGRDDDQQRGDDIQEALADDGVVCIVALRGGAWFTRVVPQIDFSVIERRMRPVAVFGFSEMTTLVNIVGPMKNGRGVYDMGPAFLTYGLKRYATMRSAETTGDPARTRDWVRSRLRPELDAFFRDVTAMIEGRGTRRPITARLVGGDLPAYGEAAFVGGNLTVLSTLVGSRYDSCARPVDRWLLIEDFNDKIERIDRFLAHLTLGGWWERCQGILLGDFHKGYEDLTAAVLALLPYHLPADRAMPILQTDRIGHVWPMSPLPLHVPVAMDRIGDEHVALRWPAAALRAV